MILLVTPSARANDCATAMHAAVEDDVLVAGSFRQALGYLRQQEFAAVVVDESLEAAEPQDGELLLQHLGTAVPVFLHFGVAGIDRVIRELRLALRRRNLEFSTARRDAEQLLRSQLRGTLTALLLSCELALEVRNLPSAA